MSETAKNIRLLWLYDDLLDLYGDFGNLLCLQRRLEQAGFSCTIDRKSCEQNPCFSEYDFIYVGPGKARNLAHAAKHFVNYAQEFKEAVHAGKVMLFTGNARLLLGKSFTLPDGEEIAGIGLFDYTGRDTGNVFVSDIVAKEKASGKEILCYGFVNRTAQIDQNTGPYLFETLYGCGDAEKSSGFEGNLTENLFSTWLLGPVLAKNPDLAAEIFTRLTGEISSYDDTLERTALERTLKEFSLSK